MSIAPPTDTAAPVIALEAEAAVLLCALPTTGKSAESTVLVTVLAVRGSAPRAVGARLLARGGSLAAGTIGGGHLEQLALTHAGALDARWTAARQAGVALGACYETAEFALGPALAQCCGGVVLLGWQRVEAGEVAGATWLPAGQGHGRVWATQLGDFALHEQEQIPWTVIVFGGGHVGRALMQALAVLPWRRVVVDARPDQADPAAFDAGVEVICRPPLEQLRAWGWPGALGGSQGSPSPERALALVMTHDHALDAELSAALLLGRDDAGAPLRLVGLIGSRSKLAGIRRKLEATLPAAAVARLVAPIGVRDAAGDLMGGKTPAEIALSTAAQLIDVAHQADLATRAAAVRASAPAAAEGDPPAVPAPGAP